MVDPLVAAAAVVLEPPPVSLLGGAGRTNSALTALFAGHSSTTRCSPSPSGTTAFGPGTATARRAIEAATAGTRPASTRRAMSWAIARSDSGQRRGNPDPAYSWSGRSQPWRVQ